MKRTDKYGVVQLRKDFPTDEACLEFVFAALHTKECACGGVYKAREGRKQYQCSKCRFHISPLAIEFLTIDHINNDGAEDRRNNKLKNGGPIMNIIGYKNAREGIFPPTLQTLCWNCNCAKASYKICPHQGVDK